MNYQTVDSIEPALQLLSERLITRLQKGEKVLWLLSGGSGAAVCIAVSKQLQAAHLLTSNLFITVSDERYGAVGHADENVQQLLDGGFVTGDATFYRPLQGKSRQETTRAFSDWLATTKQTVDYSIALLGIGADGHTSGIKPHSPAVTATAPAIDFTGVDYERITTTAHFLASIDEGIVQAMGTEKHATLQALIHTTLPISEQPAQCIKHIKTVTVFTDYKEGNI